MLLSPTNPKNFLKIINNTIMHKLHKDNKQYYHA